MFKLTDCFAIVGNRGCGKSYLCRKIQDVFPKVVVIDALKEYTPTEERKKGGVFFDSFDHFCDHLLELKTSRKKRFRIIFQFDPANENNDVVFDQLLKVIYQCGNMLVVVEEVHLYASTHKVPLWLKNCFLTGRHRNLSIAITTQRPGELNKTILSQCEHVFVGRAHENNDLKYLSNFLGAHADKLANLEKRKFIYWRPGHEPRLVSNDLSKKT